MSYLATRGTCDCGEGRGRDGFLGWFTDLGTCLMKYPKPSIGMSFVNIETRSLWIHDGVLWRNTTQGNPYELVVDNSKAGVVETGYSKSFVYVPSRIGEIVLTYDVQSISGSRQEYVNIDITNLGEIVFVEWNGFQFATATKKVDARTAVTDGDKITTAGGEVVFSKSEYDAHIASSNEITQTLWKNALQKVSEASGMIPQYTTNAKVNSVVRELYIEHREDVGIGQYYVSRILKQKNKHGQNVCLVEIRDFNGAVVGSAGDTLQEEKYHAPLLQIVPDAEAGEYGISGYVVVDWEKVTLGGAWWSGEKDAQITSMADRIELSPTIYGNAHIITSNEITQTLWKNALQKVSEASGMIPQYTTNAKVNSVVRELYIEHREDVGIGQYYVSRILKQKNKHGQNVCLVEIRDFNGAVVGSAGDTLQEEKYHAPLLQIVPDAEAGEYGISGYVVVDWEKVTLGGAWWSGEKDAQITSMADRIELSPTIYGKLTESGVYNLVLHAVEDIGDDDIVHGIKYDIAGGKIEGDVRLRLMRNIGNKRSRRGSGWKPYEKNSNVRELLLFNDLESDYKVSEKVGWVCKEDGDVLHPAYLFSRLCYRTHTQSGMDIIFDNEGSATIRSGYRSRTKICDGVSGVVRVTNLGMALYRYVNGKAVKRISNIAAFGIDVYHDGWDGEEFVNCQAYYQVSNQKQNYPVRKMMIFPTKKED